MRLIKHKKIANIFEKYPRYKKLKLFKFQCKANNLDQIFLFNRKSHGHALAVDVAQRCDEFVTFAQIDAHDTQRVLT